MAVLLTNFPAPIFAYHPSGAPAGSIDSYQAFGIGGAGQTLPAPGAYDGGGVDELGVYLPAIGAFAYRPTGSAGAYDAIDYIGPPGGSAWPSPPRPTTAGSATPRSASTSRPWPRS